MLLDIVAYLINSIVVLAVLGFLAKATGKKVPPGVDGVYRLRMHKLYYFMGVAMLLIVLVFIIVMFVEAPDRMLFFLTSLIVLLLGSLGILCILYYKNYQIIFNHTFVEVRNVLGNSKLIALKDVEQVTFNSFTGMIILKSSNGEKLKVHQHLVGLNLFTNTLRSQKHLQPENIKLPN